MQEDIDRWMKELKKGATKFSILALLRDGDMYGYELRHEFEARAKGVLILAESNASPIPELNALRFRHSIARGTGQGGTAQSSLDA